AVGHAPRRWPAPGHGHRGGAAAPTAAGAGGGTAPVVALAAGRPGAGRRRAGLGTPASIDGGGRGPALLGAGRRAGAGDGPAVGLHRTPLRLGQPEPAAAFAAGTADAARRLADRARPRDRRAVPRPGMDPRRWRGGRAVPAPAAGAAAAQRALDRAAVAAARGAGLDAGRAQAPLNMQGRRGPR